jgi:phosphatidate phosphatase APP1
VAPTLRRFLTRNAYPAGALLLTDWGPTTDRWFRAGAAHKVQNLERLARNFPHVRWILIGDDGQHDPEIYSGFVHRYPEHVAAIVIRNLSPAEAVLAGTPLVNEERRVTIPEGTLWIEGNDGASISRQLAEHGLL